MKQLQKVRLVGGIFRRRYQLNKNYLMELKTNNLLQNHYGEAGLWNPWWGPNDCHMGWENPASSIRGHFLGHWMSGAAKSYYFQGDEELKNKLYQIIDGLERCQRENGGEWVHSCPDKYLRWLLVGRLVGVPHYNIHKTMMGLWDSYEYAGSQKALDILVRFTEYFYRFATELTPEKMEDVLDFETGGMMEIFASLYGVTKDEKHLTLMKKYERKRLFDPLLAGKDVLTNMHANTTVPEAMGMAKAYEVTGDDYYLDRVKAYWKCGVTDRGYYATGGANSGEIWCPGNDLTGRMGKMNQEHCTQYNLIRLAEFLFRQTGDKEYGDFIERSLYNSILAQQNPQNGMVAYYLPLMPGGKKAWSTKTASFWCCSGTLVQAHSQHPSYVAYTEGDTIIVNQYIGIGADCPLDSGEVKLHISEQGQGGEGQGLKNYNPGAVTKPNNLRYGINIANPTGKPVTLKMRKPWWATSIELQVNGSAVEVNETDGFIVCSDASENFNATITFGKEFSIVPMPYNDNLVAIMDGPYVLAALTDQEIMLPEDFSVDKNLRYVDTRHWGGWRDEYLLTLPGASYKVMRLYEIADDAYSVYFAKK